MKSSVCTIVVTYNQKDLLQKCLRANLQQTRPSDAIIVVNNASTDGTKTMLHNEFPQIQVLDMTENLGGAGGFCAGMHEAYRRGFDWVWTMDDDAEPERSCLENLVRVASEENQIYAAVPLEPQTRQLCWPARLVDSHGKKDGMIYQIDEETKPTFEVYIAGLLGTMFHRRALATVGYPNPAFFIRGDEIEYSLRLRNAGFFPLYVRDAIIFHPAGKTSRKIKILGKDMGRFSYVEPWKSYYRLRNGIYIKMYVEKNYVKVFWFAIFNFLFVFVEDRKSVRFRLYFRALKDGFLRNLGKTVLPK